MVKQGILLVLFSIAAIFFKSELMHVLRWLLWIHNKVASWFALVFSNDSAGQIIQAILSLLLIPVIIGSVIALVYWAIKRGKMPYTMATIWVFWIILLTTMLAQAG